jgi:hypothetical protein
MVRLTESRLPPGYLPEDLGEVATTPENDSYLISYLTSPIRRGATNTYVLFIVESDLVEKVASYKWLVKPADTMFYLYYQEFLTSGAIFEWIDDKCTGVFRHTFEAATDIFGGATATVLVELKDAEGNTLRTLELQQEIIAPNASLEKIFRQTAFSEELDGVLQRIASGGHPPTTREVVNNFDLYINEAFEKAEEQSSISDDLLVPKQLLAAIVYLHAMEVPEKKRQDILEDAAQELNSVGTIGALTKIFTDLTTPLGVCQISPQMAALVASKNPSSGNFVSYLGWREFGENENTWGDDQKKLISDFEDLSKEYKVDLLNLVRFPKSNIRICYELLLTLKQREHRYDQVGLENFLDDKNAIKVISNELEIGPVLSSSSHKALTSGEFGSKVVDTMLAPYLAIEFDGQLKVEGQVKDQNNESIANARVDIFSTKVVVNHDGLKVFRDSNIGNADYIKIRVPEDSSVELPVLDVRRSVTVDGNFLEGNNDLVKVVLESEVLDVNTGWLVLRSGNDSYGYLDSSSCSSTTDDQGRFSILVRELQPYFIRVVSADCGFKDFESEELEVFHPTQGWFIPPQNIDIWITREPGLVRESHILEDLRLFGGFSYQEPPGGGYPDTLAFGTNAQDECPGNISNECPGNIFGIVTTFTDQETGISYRLWFPEGNQVKQNNCTTFTEGLLINAWMKISQPPNFRPLLNTRLQHDINENDTVLTLRTPPLPGLVGVTLEVGIGQDVWQTPEVTGVDPITNNVTFSTRVGHDANAGTRIRYRLSDHAFWMPIAPCTDWWGSITIVRERGMAWNTLLQAEDPPKPWSLVQAYTREPPANGHSFIVLDYHDRSKKVLLLESNFHAQIPSNNGGGGPGFRNIGHIDREQVDGIITPNRSKPWHQKGVGKWSDLFDNGGWQTQFTQMAQLKVCDLQIARKPTL